MLILQHTLFEEHEHGHEPSHHLNTRSAVPGQFAERHRLVALGFPCRDQPVAHHQRLGPQIDQRHVQLVDRYFGGGCVGDDLGGQLGEFERGQRPYQLRQHGGNALVHGRRMRESAGIGGDTRPEITGGLLVGAVLEESGEQQIAFAQRLETLLVVLVVFAAGQNRHAFGLDQNRGDVEKGAGLIHVFREVEPAHVCQEFLGDRGEGNFGQLEFVVGDHAEQGIERTGIDLEVDPEAGGGGFLRADFGFRGAPLSLATRASFPQRGEPRKGSLIHRLSKQSSRHDAASNELTCHLTVFL